MADWSLYLIKCGDGKLYTGITNDLDKRIEQHASGQGAKFTRGRGPLQIVFSQTVGDRSRASKLEWRVKKLRRYQKEELASGKLALESLLES